MDDRYALGHACGRGRNRSVFGESLIALAALLGFIVPYARGQAITASDMRNYAIFLLIIVVFYFLILLARFIFIAMADSMGQGLEWAKLAAMHKERSEKK